MIDSACFQVKPSEDFKSETSKKQETERKCSCGNVRKSEVRQLISRLFEEDELAERALPAIDCICNSFGHILAT